MNKTLLILGASSDISVALAHKFAVEGWDIMLAGRDTKSLSIISKDLLIRYEVKITEHFIDILDTENFNNFLTCLPLIPDVVINAVGVLGHKDVLEQDYKMTKFIFRSNFEGPALIMLAFAKKFAERKSGTLIGISSVAGIRGRSSNYIYGSAKSGFTTLLSGLRGELSKYNVNVITILPGFVNTRMTSDLNLPPFLTSSPKEVAIRIYKALQNGKEIVYVGSIWRWIMLVIVLIPEKIFKSLKF